MNFGEALQQLKLGKKVSRSVWKGYWQLWKSPILEADSGAGSGYKMSCQFTKGMIVATLADFKGVAPAQPYQEDLLAEDWQIVE